MSKIETKNIRANGEENAVPARRPQLDDKDRILLFRLSLDARLNLTQLAAEVGLSKQVVSYRLKQLERSGVIRGVHAIPDIRRLGLTHYRVFVKFQHMDLQTEQRLIEHLSRQREIAWLTLLDGDFDLEFVVWSASTTAFETLYDDIMGLFGAYFQEKYFSIATRIEYLPYKFLAAPDNPSALVVGGRPGDFQPDELDKRILAALNRDGRLSLAELAAQCGAGQALVKNRLEHLHESGVILGYGLKVDHNRLGFTYRKVLLKLHNHTPQVREALSGHLRRHRNVIFLVKTIGSYDFEFELMTESNEEFHHIIRDFRSAFAPDIKLHHTVIVYDELKYGLLNL